MGDAAVRSQTVSAVVRVASAPAFRVIRLPTVLLGRRDGVREIVRMEDAFANRDASATITPDLVVLRSASRVLNGADSAYSTRLRLPSRLQARFLRVSR